MFIAHWVRACGGARLNTRVAALGIALCAALLVPTRAEAISDHVVSQWLTTELLKLPKSRAPGETREEFEERVGEVSGALAEQARRFADGRGWSMTELAAAGAVIWYKETLLDKRIQIGEPHPIWNQDHGLARCGMQLHQSGLVPQEIWEKLVGQSVDAVRLCAQYGLRVVVAQAKQCGVYFGQRANRNRVAQMMASYGTGGQCTPADRHWERADLWLRFMASRPDHEKKSHPGFRRAAPGEVPHPIKTAADGIVAAIGKQADVVPGYERRESVDGRLFALVVERHAQGKIGVSVLVRE